MNQEATIAGNLNGMIVTREQVDDAGGEYNSEKNCYNFPDGSAGRLIDFSNDEPACQFVELKRGC